MSKQTAGCLIAAVLIYLVLGAVLTVFVLTDREDFESPATASRNVYGFNSGNLGTLRELSRKSEQSIPAPVPMEAPQLYRGKKNSLALEWEVTSEVEPGDPPRTWSKQLKGDDQLELVAIGTWYPAPNDPHESDPDWRPSVKVRQPESLEALSSAQLEELGVPKKLLRLETPKDYHTPRLSLFFKHEGMEIVRFNSFDLSDQRTEAIVSYDVERLREQPNRSVTLGNWTRLDAAMLIWHDSPIKARVSLLTGQPSFQTLQPSLGEQVTFGNHIRLQWLASVPDSFYVSSYMGAFEPANSVSKEVAARLREMDHYNGSSGSGQAFHVRPSDSSNPEPHTLLRASSRTTLMAHVGLETKDGILWDWDSEEEEAPFFLASIKAPDPKAPMRLVFLPFQTELTFEIPRLPDAPNSRDTADLFENRLPRVTLPADVSDAERQLIGYASVGAQVAWELDLVWGDHPPNNLPDHHTFLDTSPQELLDWYLDNTRGAKIRYDLDGLILHVNEEKENWWTRTLEKLEMLGLF